MQSFTEFLQERVGTSVMYRVKGAMGSHADIRYRHDGGDKWRVSTDGGKTWNQATSDDSSPLYNIQDIEAELEAGSLEKVTS